MIGSKTQNIFPNQQTDVKKITSVQFLANREDEYSMVGQTYSDTHFSVVAGKRLKNYCKLLFCKNALSFKFSLV